MTFNPGDKAEEYRDSFKIWTPCEIINVSLMNQDLYHVKGSDGYVSTRHIDWLREVSS